LFDNSNPYNAAPMPVICCEHFPSDVKHPVGLCQKVILEMVDAVKNGLNPRYPQKKAGNGYKKLNIVNK
jgi:hypothetical protein